MVHSVSPATVFSCFYWLVAFCFVACSPEFQSAGFTIQTLFSSWLGSESIDFVKYHMKRTVITTVVHSSLPLGYFICMTFVGESGLGYLDLSAWAIHVGWQLYFYFAIAVFVAGATLAYHWCADGCRNHPLVKNLNLFDGGGGGDAWPELAAQVNAEFRGIDKYTSGAGGTSRVIVTDNWLAKTGAYDVKLVHQDHAMLTVCQTQEYQMSPETRTTVQYVKLNVRCQKSARLFDVRVVSTEYQEFKAKLRVRVYVLPNITIHQSAVEMFLQAFREHVERNPIYVVDSNRELGSCIGCESKPVNVKLNKLCAERDEGPCENCNCNPLWCLECMGRWYASRQDQAKSDEWLGGFATCPMCRAKFCMLDVSYIQRT